MRIGSAMKACFYIAECSLISAKLVPASAMKVYFYIAECSLMSAKLVPASAMKVYFYIAECSLISAKLHIIQQTAKEKARVVVPCAPIIAPAFSEWPSPFGKEPRIEF